MRYVALLRAVNVGGANKVDMRDLRAAFEAAGMTSVTTYINSGNVLFHAEIEDHALLTTVLEDAIRERLGLHIDALVLDIGQVRAIVAALPAHWTNDASMKCDVLFLWKEVDRPSVLEELEITPGIEDVLYTPGAVIRRIDRAHVTKSRFTKMVGTPLYKQMTIRNCNTARRLLELLEE